jgi:hypothetical protein
MSFQAADRSIATQTSPAIERAFLRATFAWMFVGLGLTAGIAVWFSSNDALMEKVRTQPGWLIGAMVAQLAVVFGLAFMINRISASLATFLFVLYAALTGATFSIILGYYSTSSIAMAFAGATGVFGGMAVWGFATKRDLTGLAPILFGALIGFLVASIVFAFTGGSTFNLILGFAGVLIFAALTAYDVQKIKAYAATAMDDESARKMAIFGALQLYLDFVNIFLSLLRIFGSNR